MWLMYNANNFPPVPPSECFFAQNNMHFIYLCPYIWNEASKEFLWSRDVAKRQMNENSTTLLIPLDYEGRNDGWII